MPSETIAASVPTDSTLYERFEEYRRSRAIASKSEATRELLNSGLETELDYAGGRTIIDGNESILLSLAYIISAEELLSVMITVGGTAAGVVVFTALGTLLVSWLLADYQPDIIFRRLRRLRS
jgi:metal-responsive CopG/Arc/MetJ family transcriptional regulator